MSDFKTFADSPETPMEALESHAEVVHSAAKSPVDPWNNPQPMPTAAELIGALIDRGATAVGRGGFMWKCSACGEVTVEESDLAERMRNDDLRCAGCRK